MSADEDLPELEGRPWLEGQRALVLTGEVIRTASPDRLLRLGSALSMLVEGEVNAHIVDGYDAIDAENEPEPMPATFGDIRRFAIDNGYSKVRANKAWHALGTATARELAQRVGYDPYPKVRFLPAAEQRGFYDQHVDLRSVHDRLMASDFSNTAWPWLKRTDKETVKLLADFVRAKLGSPPNQ